MDQQHFVVICLILALANSAKTLTAASVDGKQEVSPVNSSFAVGVEPSARSNRYFVQSVNNEKDIDRIYRSNMLPEISYSINQLDTGSRSSFKKMVGLQIYLFNKYNLNGDYHDLYTFNVAYYFYQIQMHPYYYDLSTTTRNKLNDIINILPPSLNYLFFKPSFCLYNRKYSEYIYTTTAIEIDQERRYVFVWNTPNNVGSNGRWVREIKDVSNNRKLKLKFSLKSEQVQMYLYLERKQQNLLDLVAAWRSGRQPSNSEWSVQLYQNQLIFSQNERIMCASDLLYNRSRRYVYGYKNNNNYSDMSPACQWYARECP